jgi:hypothetical protein
MRPAPAPPFDSFALSLTVEGRAFLFPGGLQQLKATQEHSRDHWCLPTSRLGETSLIRERDGAYDHHERVRSIFSITYKIILGLEISRGLIGRSGESNYLGVEGLAAIRSGRCG